MSEKKTAAEKVIKSKAEFVQSLWIFCACFVLCRITPDDISWIFAGTLVFHSVLLGGWIVGWLLQITFNFLKTK